MTYHGLFMNAKRGSKRIDQDDLYVYKDQLHYKGHDLFKQIPSLCDDCQANDGYKFWIQEVSGLATNAWGGVKWVYWLRCQKCASSYEISAKDFKSLQVFMTLNKDLVAETITYEDYLDTCQKQVIKIFKKRYPRGLWDDEVKA